MKYLNKIIEYGLYLLVFLLPLQTRWIIKAGQLNNGPWEYGTYSLYGTDIMLVLLLLAFVIYKFLIFNFQFSNNFQFFNFQTRWTHKLARTFIWGLIIISAISMIFSVDKPLALYKFGWLILGLGIFWLIIGANYDRLKLIYAMLAGAFLSAGLGIWQFLNQATFASKWLGLAWHRGADLGAVVIETVGADGIGERWLRAYGSLDHPNILGGLLAISILLLVVEIIKINKLAEEFLIFNFKFLNKFKISNLKFQIKSEISKTSVIKIVNWLLLAVFTVGLFFSFSRGAWLAPVSGLVVMIVLAIVQRNFKLQKGLAEIILVMGIMSLVLFSQYQNLVVTRLISQGRLENKSNSERLVSFKASWQMIKSHWLVGVGPGNYTSALNRATPGQESYYYQPAHNVFFLVWAEVGIFGLLFFLGLIAYLIIFNFPFFAKASEDKQFSLLRESFGGQAIFKQFSINKFSKPSLKIACLSGRQENYKLKIRENDYTNNSIFNISVLTALVVLMFFDHWLWSLHFGVLFFWLVLGLIYRINSSPSKFTRTL